MPVPAAPVDDLESAREGRLPQLESFARQITQTAGEEALRAFRSTVTLEFKGRAADDPVTVVDRRVEEMLRQSIRAQFPGHGLLGEELADEHADTAEWVWVMDPLDGTANFASGLPLWTVSLGLLHRGEPVVGCLWSPVGPGLRQGVFHARKGGGAWFEDEPLVLAPSSDDRGRLAAVPARYETRFRLRATPGARRGLELRSLGSVTVEMALVASGTLRWAMFITPRIWDVAAGGVIVTEAGGSVQSCRSGSWSPLERYEPLAPPGRRPRQSMTNVMDAPPALRHWSQPVLAAPPTYAASTADRISWRRRLPGPLRRLVPNSDPRDAQTTTPLSG